MRVEIEQSGQDWFIKIYAVEFDNRLIYAGRAESLATAASMLKEYADAR